MNFRKTPCTEEHPRQQLSITAENRTYFPPSMKEQIAKIAIGIVKTVASISTRNVHVHTLIEIDGYKYRCIPESSHMYKNFNYWIEQELSGIRGNYPFCRIHHSGTKVAVVNLIEKYNT